MFDLDIRSLAAELLTISRDANPMSSGDSDASGRPVDE